MFSFPGVFLFFFFLCLHARISHPHCFLLCLNCIYHIPSHDSILRFACLSTLLDKMEGGWLRVSFVCHLICRLFVSFVTRISFVYLLWLIPLLASTPYSCCAIFCPQDFMAWRFANMGVILHWFLLYFIFCPLAYMKCHCQLSLAVYLDIVSDRLYFGGYTCMRT